MTLPLTTILPEDYKDLRNELTANYEKQSRAINGNEDRWTPVIEGSTTDGVGTYTNQIGYYYRQGLMTDVWFFITWSAHTGTGNMRVTLPLKIRRAAENFFVGELEITGLTLNANYTYATIQGENDSRLAYIMENGGGQTLQNIAVFNGAAEMRGHLRYIGQEGA